jgi:hypothetical protein
MTNPAVPGQLRNAISTQGSTTGRHKELLRGLVEGVQTLAQHCDRALDSLLEQFHGLSGMAAYHSGKPTAPQQLSC